MKKYWQNIFEHWTNKVKSHFEQTGGLHLAASKFVYNLVDKNLLAVFRRILLGIMYYIAERAVQIKFYAKAILFGDCFAQ